MSNGSTPITIKGGSLRIHCRKAKLIDEESEPDGSHHYKHSLAGKITGVTIDRKDYPAHEKSEIVIHYQASDTPTQSK